MVLNVHRWFANKSWFYARMSDLASMVMVALGGENASVEPVKFLEACRACTVKQGDTLWAIAENISAKVAATKKLSA